MDEIYDSGNLDVPVNIGIAGTVIELLFNFTGRKSVESEAAAIFQKNFLIGFEDKREKWIGILKSDLINKEKCSNSEVRSILASTFIEKYFNKYLKTVYYLYFSMGYSKYTSKEEQIIEGLKAPIDSICSELLTFIKTNVNDHLFKTIYGPIFRSFVNDAYSDGTGYAAMSALNNLKNNR